MALLVVVPPALVTLIGPVVAPVGTVVVMVLAAFTLKLAAVPLNFTVVVPTKPLPITVTFCPTIPLEGVNLSRTGLGQAIHFRSARWCPHLPGSNCCRHRRSPSGREFRLQPVTERFVVQLR